MADDVPGLTEAEQKYFDTKGTELPAGVVESLPPEEAEKPAEQPKPAVEPAKAAEKPAETDAEPEALKVVDKRALDEERNRRKEYQKRNNEKDAEIARLLGQLDVLRATVKPESQQKPLDPVQQPIETIVEDHQFIQELKAREQQQAAFQNFSNQYRARAHEFAQTTPDFADAYNYLHQHRANELRAAYGLDGIALENALNSNEYEITAGALQRGQNPAEVLYNIAKMRGYAGPKAADPTPVTPDPAQKTAEVLAKATDTLATIAKGQEKSKSLSSTGGAGGDGLPSIEDLLAMDNDEFEKMTKSHRAWKKIAGG